MQYTIPYWAVNRHGLDLPRSTVTHIYDPMHTPCRSGKEGWGVCRCRWCAATPTFAGSSCVQCGTPSNDVAWCCFSLPRYVLRTGHCICFMAASSFHCQLPADSNHPTDVGLLLQPVWQCRMLCWDICMTFPDLWTFALNSFVSGVLVYTSYRGFFGDDTHTKRVLRPFPGTPGLVFFSPKRECWSYQQVFTATCPYCCQPTALKNREASAVFLVL